MHPVSDGEEAGGSGMSKAPRKYVLVFSFKGICTECRMHSEHHCLNSLIIMSCSGPGRFQMKMRMTNNSLMK